MSYSNLRYPSHELRLGKEKKNPNIKPQSAAGSLKVMINDGCEAPRDAQTRSGLNQSKYIILQEQIWVRGRTKYPRFIIPYDI